jgi:uncharacterized membrane protein YdjX (TVP38/TMEM64 family)
MKKVTWDTAGILVSILCIIHCVALPLLVIFLPALSTAFLPEEALVHKVLFCMIIAVAALAFVPGYTFHKQIKPLFWLAVGLLLLIFATFFAHELLGHQSEPILAISGSLAVITAHYLNHKSCKHKCNSHQHEIEIRKRPVDDS